jgi:hypothetical protein
MIPHFSARRATEARDDAAAHRDPERLARVATIGVLAIAVVMRLPWPSTWWLNPDEGIYYAVVTRTSFADFWAEAMATAHPPLYFLILRGIAVLSTDFAWLRSVALISGVAAVYVFIALGRELGNGDARGRLTGLLAGLLIAVSPRAVALSQVVRPYMLLLLLLAAALSFLLRFARLRSNGLLVAYAACVSVALMLHYSAVLALAVFGLLVLSDGLISGVHRPEWRRLALAQLVPGLTLIVLYLSHLRRLMASSMADNALGGWLSAYMIRAPADVWLGLVGAHSALVGDALAVSATLLTLFGLAGAGWRRRWTILVLGGSAIALATAGAWAGVYPVGATRHASWLMVFVAPVMAWSVATLLVSPTGVRAGPVLLLATLLAGARPLSSILDSERRPREIAERVLQVAHVEAMSDVLSPERDPRLVLMSTETYEILTPLFTDEREAVATSSNGSLRHFRWGIRDVIVLPERDFTALPHETGSANHLHTAMRQATEEFDVGWPGDGEAVLVVAGGWRSQGMDDLVELARVSPGLGSSAHVPGLIAVALDFEAYGRALELPATADPPEGPA